MLRSIGIITLLLIALVTLGKTQPAASRPEVQIFYVDPVNGNDTTGNGSVGAPWRTITRAVPACNRGRHDQCFARHLQHGHR